MKFDLTKRKEASELILNFMATALLTILITRLWIKLDIYNQIAFGVWHIAHVLWGGLFLLISVLLTLVFYGKKTLFWASIFGGVGWGFFIDEIGKYLTKDNNYWFRPAIIFIYVSFIILFLLYRKLEKETPIDIKTRWYKLFEDMEEIINNDLEEKEKKESLKEIKELILLTNDQSKKVVLEKLKIAVEEIKPKKNKKEIDLEKMIAGSVNMTYNRWFKKKLVFFGFLAYYIWFLIDKFIDTVRVLLNPNKMMMIQNYYSHYDFFSRADVYMISIKFILDLIVAGFYLAGIIMWGKRKSLRGITLFQWGLLINVFLGSVFKFYFEQFSGIFGLILSILVLSWLSNYKRELKNRDNKKTIEGEILNA